MTREEKESFVGELRERLASAPALYLTDFTGLDVKALTDLRARLKAEGAEYLVVKNRLALRAVEGTELSDIAAYFAGPTGLVLGHRGPVEAARVLSEFRKTHEEKPALKVGVVDRALVAPERIEAIAKLPPREELLARLAGTLEAPLAELAGALQAKLVELAGLVEALRARRESEGE